MTSKKLPPIPVVHAFDRVRDALARLHRRLVPGHIALLELQFAGFLSQAISTAAELGIADQLADGPRTSAQLASALEVDEDGLRRLLRLLVSYEVFAQRRDGRYALTRIGEALRGDAAVTMREVARFFGSPYHRNHWTHLGDAVRTGEAVGQALEGASFFEYAARNRAVGDLFDRAMTSIGTLSIEPLLAASDFGRFDTVVDVGGGRGSLLVEILRRHPSTTGVVFDLPGVVEDLSSDLAAAGLGRRCTVEAGSFFEAVPAGADAYLLKNIVHDWSDEHAERILRTVRAAMGPAATLLVIELVLPEHHRPHPGKFVDLEMLVNTEGGHERTEAEFRALLDRSGFTLTRTVETVAPVCVLEAVAR
ncbi:methyltransferase [Nocardia ignorata]|uniref:Hydroxyneurosporene-O-methyltransferase n=1 Tax=Nocardia ignorata TaxID=145285 RepID=A0A4R6PJA1_NOCIG|nr:methyltransferase [Nocardia ignorata]TDP38484.1 hydroxyneurosporene-O-methyltransferase [Nocardia ignorata]